MLLRHGPVLGVRALHWPKVRAGLSWRQTLSRYWSAVLRFALTQPAPPARHPLDALLADAIYGSGTFAARLRSLCQATIAAVAEAPLRVTLECSVRGEVALAHQAALLASVHALVSNAVERGMHLHLTGMIAVTVAATPEATVLEVSDDGWGSEARPLEQVRAIADQAGGRVSERAEWAETWVRLHLPRG